MHFILKAIVERIDLKILKLIFKETMFLLFFLKCRNIHEIKLVPSEIELFFTLAKGGTLTCDLPVNKANGLCVISCCITTPYSYGCITLYEEMTCLAEYPGQGLMWCNSQPGVN